MIETREIGNNRIKIYYDTWNDCPCTNWDMVACYLFEYSRPSVLHNDCNWKEVWGKHGDNRHSLEETLRMMVRDYCDFDLFVNYIKDENLEFVRFIYDSISQLWKLEIDGYWPFSKQWDVVEEYESEDLQSKDMYMFNDLLEYCGKYTLLELLQQCGKDIHVKEWGSTGYSQGDYVNGIAFCTKERYIQMVSNDTSDWKNKLDSFIDDEVKCIGMWMWGDVKGFRLEKKVELTKIYKDGRIGEGFEWEEVESVWGCYMETEELINEVIRDYNLKEEAA